MDLEIGRLKESMKHNFFSGDVIYDIFIGQEISFRVRMDQVFNIQISLFYFQTLL
jgi:hypothetical protein